MDFAGAFVNGILTIAGYVVIFLGVYKLYHIATDIREIKDLMASARRNVPGAAPVIPSIAPAATPAITSDILAEDSADAYAQSLLRAVNTEAHRAETATHEVR